MKFYYLGAWSVPLLFAYIKSRLFLCQGSNVYTVKGIKRFNDACL